MAVYEADDKQLLTPSCSFFFNNDNNLSFSNRVSTATKLAKAFHLKNSTLCHIFLKLVSKYQNKGRKVQGPPKGQMRIKADNKLPVSAEN